MKVFIVYCHPSQNSFTREIKDSFISGLEAGGHSYTISDLYAMGFNTDLSEAEYNREAYYKRELPLPPDVEAEHKKINACDAIVFIHPIFWTDAPAKLVGWLNRVWTFGFAYGSGRSMKLLEKGLVLCSAGNTLEYFQRTGLGDAMKRVFLDDRFFDRVKKSELIIFEATSRELKEREEYRKKHLRRAYELGANIAE
jgi:NAD(P)H dehydrogenase (quinone)